MGNQEYLIPANSKKSMLIIGMFTVNDLIILITGCVLTGILLFVGNTSSLLGIFVVLLPLLSCALMVMPVPNQHNFRTFIKNVYEYFTKTRVYYWKGWCIDHGEESK